MARWWGGIDEDSDDMAQWWGGIDKYSVDMAHWWGGIVICMIFDEWGSIFV